MTKELQRGGAGPLVLRWQGRYEEIIASPKPEGLPALDDHLCRADAYGVLGKKSTAATHFDAAVDLDLFNDRRASDAPWALAWSDRADVAAELHEQFRQLLYHEIMVLGPTNFTGIGSHLLGLLSIVIGERTRAEEEFRRAAEICDEMNARASKVRLASARAHNLIRLDGPTDRGLAREILEDATTQAPRLSMAIDELWAHDLLHQL